MPSWGGSKFALSTYLARRVRRMMSDESAWRRLPDDVREWLEVQKDHSAIVSEDEMLAETFPLGKTPLPSSAIRSRGASRTPPWPCC